MPTTKRQHIFQLLTPYVFTPTPNKNETGWFFRVTVGPVVEAEEGNTADDGVHHDEHVERGTAREQKPSLLSAIRRPSSLQPRGSRNLRHLWDESVSIGRSASNTLVAPSVEDLGLGLWNWNWNGKEDGWKRFLGGIRWISLEA
jgi:hypothetical protein